MNSMNVEWNDDSRITKDHVVEQCREIDTKLDEINYAHLNSVELTVMMTATMRFLEDLDKILLGIYQRK